MTCLTCPNCGFDLERLERLTIGDLDIIAGGAEIRWKGRRLRLAGTKALILMALARAGGALVSHDAIGEAAGYDGDWLQSYVNVQLFHIRKAFRAIDPSFDRIESAGHGRTPGADRWRVDVVS